MPQRSRALVNVYLYGAERMGCHGLPKRMCGEKERPIFFCAHTLHNSLCAPTSSYAPINMETYVHKYEWKRRIQVSLLGRSYLFFPITFASKRLPAIQTWQIETVSSYRSTFSFFEVDLGLLLRLHFILMSRECFPYCQGVRFKPNCPPVELSADVQNRAKRLCLIN